MNKTQLSTALAMAQSDESLEAHATNVFDGFALASFSPVVVTIPQIAWLIRWQCVHIMGAGIDATALNEIADMGRHRFMVLGADS